jgi:hypothetical protein
VTGDRGAYLEKFGKWRDSLNWTVVGSFGIQAESYSVWLVKIRLCCGRVAFRAWHCLARVAEWIIQELLVKIRQDKYWKVKAYGK